MPEYVYNGRKKLRIIYKNNEYVLRSGDVIDISHIRLPNKLNKSMKIKSEAYRVDKIEYEINKIREDVRNIDTDRNRNS